MIKYTTNLQQILDLHLKKTNLSRKKMLCAIILAILERKSVKFTDLSEELNEDVQDSSNMRRIQSFFSDFDFQYFPFARLMLSFVPNLRLDLSIDRTNWKFGEVDFNVLTLTVRFKGVGIPILFEMLDKKGNSNQTERQDLLDKFIVLFGVKRINSLCADREFVGDNWFKYLIDNNIPFYIRLKKNQRITLGGIHYHVETLCNICQKRKKTQIDKVEYHGMTNLVLGLKKLSPGNRCSGSDEDYLAVISNKTDKKPLQEYRKRWSIEAFFQSIKKRGVDIEQTHLTDPSRLKKLFALVSLAFAMSLCIGVRHNESVKSIEIKNHGYKQNSFANVGMTKIRKAIKQVKTDYSILKNILNYIFDKLSKISFTFGLSEKIIT
jgi:Transposase DDE domain